MILLVIMMQQKPEEKIGIVDAQWVNHLELPTLGHKVDLRPRSTSVICRFLSTVSRHNNIIPHSHKHTLIIKFYFIFVKIVFLID